MPELPEVETMVRGLRPAVEGRVIVGMRRCRCRCRPITVTPNFPTFARRVRGARIQSVRRLAKRVVMELSTGEAMAIEPRMTGLMLLADPPDSEHLRIEWQLDAGRSFWFWDRRGLGTVRLFRPDELNALSAKGTLGQDALEMSEADWRRACARTARPIKVALLDQKFAAGIGNLYASEILHRAKIHPARKTSELPPRDVRRLHRAVQEVLHEAIVHEGSTLGDATYRTALNQNGRYQNKHRVYQRAGTPCPTCRRAPIERIVQAQRSTFFCPICQPLLRDTSPKC